MLLAASPFLSQPSGSFINGQLNGAVYTRAGAAWYYDAAGVYQTATQDQPLFDHDPVTGAFRGLLIEPAATNSVRYSDDCSVVDATRMNRFDCATPSANLMVENAGSSLQPTLQYLYDVTINTVYYFSAVIQHYPGTLAKRYVGIRPARNSVGDAFRGVEFDIENGTVAATLSPAFGGVESAGPGKTRIWLSSPAASATVPGNHFDFQPATAPGAGVSAPYNGDGSSGILISGVQCEVGRLTTRIPTGSAAVTRNAPALLLPWARAGVADGTIGIRYIFDDLSTQDTTATVAGGWSTVPTNLTRQRLLGWLKL